MATHSSILAWKIPWTKGVWQATVHGVAKSWTRLSPHAGMYVCVCVCMCVSRSVMSDSCDPMDWSPPGSSVYVYIDR